MNQNQHIWKAPTYGEIEQNILYEEFKEQNEALTARVCRVSNAEASLSIILNLIRETGASRVAAAGLSMIDETELERRARAAGIEYCTNPSREFMNNAQLGIAGYDLGIAELGTLVQDARSIHTRLVSMLPPAHIALVRTSMLVRTFEDALDIIAKTYGAGLPEFLAYVTGPSRTSDIECVSTIGVHGPEFLMILCID